MFTVSDGIQIDIIENLIPEHRALLVLWPCMTGNTAMYRLPVSNFNSAGISVVQINPRGHGESGGQFDLEFCTRDLNEYLYSLNMEDIPLWLIGHSAGASAVLKYGTFYKPARRFILVSPVLDSIESYKYLYEKGNQAEANTLISSFTTDRELMLSLLENNRWMDRDVWKQNSYRQRIDAISQKALIGSLMEKLFLEGYNAFHDLQLHKDRISILLPLMDNWFPMNVTLGLAAKHGIRTETINEGKDHYFTGAWKYIWRHVLNGMIRQQ